jgi:glutathione S-transferase
MGHTGKSEQMIRLYDYILSADCYKIRLMLALLGREFEPVKINIHPGRENQSPEFLSINPRGRIPVLDDGGLVVSDPIAILTYLALRYDANRTWLPDDAALIGKIMMWLAFSAAELDRLSQIRTNAITSAGGDPPGAMADAYNSLTILEDHLAEAELKGQSWMVGNHPTIADIAVFPPVILSPDGEVSLDGFPAIWRWLDRVKRLPGFIVMPGIMPNLAGVV